jgi:DNA-binding CsgD family transcriptional regulator
MPKTLRELEAESATLRARYDELLARYNDLLSRSMSARDVGNGHSAAVTPGHTAIEQLLAPLTLKQHAVILGFLGGLTYAEIAEHMQVDQTTVKLHLRAALNHFGAQSRDQFAITHGKAINDLSSKQYEDAFGLPKEWWKSKSKPLWEALTRRRAGSVAPPPGGIKPTPPPARRKHR